MKHKKSTTTSGDNWSLAKARSSNRPHEQQLAFDSRAALASSQNTKNNHPNMNIDTNFKSHKEHSSQRKRVLNHS